MAARHDAIPEHIWQAILAEVRQGTSYAEVARRWGPRVEKQFGRKLSAAVVSREIRQRTGPADPHQPVWDVLDRALARLTPADLAALPTDLADEHDHYLYGSPKRQ